MVRGCLIAFAVLVAASGSDAAESTDTLADRLRALRKGWSFTSDQPAEKPAAKPRASAVVSDVVRVPGDDGGALPRVDPRDVLPRRWFRDGVSAPVASSGGRTSATVSDRQGESGEADGTARSRMLRDARGAGESQTRVAGRALLEPMVGRRPLVVTTDRAKPAGVARAGSVLSGETSTPSDAAATPTAEGPAKSSANAAIARAIAADVAESLAGDEGEFSFDDGASDSASGSESSRTADSEIVSAPADAEGSVASNTATNKLTNDEPLTERGVLRVAMNPTAKASGSGAAASQRRSSRAKASREMERLPLFIGERSSKPAARTGFASSAGSVEPRSSSRGGAQPPALAAEATPNDQWLLTQSMPVLVSRVQGPRSIVVGREATYRVVLANRGDADADDVVTRVSIPAGVDLVATSARRGQVSRDVAQDSYSTEQYKTDAYATRDRAAGDRVVTWELERLGAEETVTLQLRVVARSGRPIELGVASEHRPIDAATVVQVQEPKLEMKLAGPDEVLYGKAQVYRLTLTNPGTGPAEDVVLRLTPPGQKGQGTTHTLGDLAPGDSRSVEIELVAREAGKLEILADAKATGDVQAETRREILCRKPELVVDWRGPDERYAGAPALYYFRVRNPGSATAPGVDLTVGLPEGFRVTNAGDGRVAVARRLTYRVGALAAGEDRYFELRGIFERAGENQLVLAAEGSDETESKSVVARTTVIALADLKLDILDPKGPIATGSEIAYQIRVTNRGANAARDVRVVGLFSEGIEPTRVEGGPSQIEDGRVAFHTIRSLPAGAEQVFTIRAKADQAGTHLFRAEVLCRDLEIKLAAEETTRFFLDDTLDVAADGGGYYPR
ncbi:MAG: hypothetical protein AAFV43_14970 [Planctomycetota bacterium]